MSLHLEEGPGHCLTGKASQVLRICLWMLGGMQKWNPMQAIFKQSGLQVLGYFCDVFFLNFCRVCQLIFALPTICDLFGTTLSGRPQCLCNQWIVFELLLLYLNISPNSKSWILKFTHDLFMVPFPMITVLNCKPENLCSRLCGSSRINLQFVKDLWYCCVSTTRY